MVDIYGRYGKSNRTSCVPNMVHPKNRNKKQGSSLKFIFCFMHSQTTTTLTTLLIPTFLYGWPGNVFGPCLS